MLVYVGNKVLVKARNPFVQRVYWFIYGISIRRLSNNLNIPQEKIQEDIAKGYLRVFEEAPNVIFKDWFYYRYVEEKGNTNKLVPFGYALSPPRAKSYYNYILFRKEPKNKKYYYEVLAPNGEVKRFEGATIDEAFSKAKQYAFENQMFGDDVPKHQYIEVRLTMDEIYFLISIIPNNYHFTKQKLYCALTILKNKKYNDIVFKLNGDNYDHRII